MTKQERAELRRQVTRYWTSSQETVLMLLNALDDKDELINELCNWANDLLEATNRDDVTESDIWIDFDRKLEQLKARAAQ